MGVGWVGTGSLVGIGFIKPRVGLWVVSTGLPLGNSHNSFFEHILSATRRGKACQGDIDPGKKASLDGGALNQSSAERGME